MATPAAIRDRTLADRAALNPGPDALDEEIDDALRVGRMIDVDDIHEGFVDGTVRMRPDEQAILGDTHPGGPGAGLPIEDRPQSIADRMRSVSTLPDAYATWYRRLTVKRMCFRGIAADKIAAHTNVSLRTVERDIKKINEELAKQLVDKPVVNYVGESVLFYSEVRGMALQIATNGRNTPSARLSGLDTAIRAQKASEGLLEIVGYLKSSPIIPRKSETDKNTSQADLMQSLIAQFVGSDDKAIEDMVNDTDKDADTLSFL